MQDWLCNAGLCLNIRATLPAVMCVRRASNTHRLVPIEETITRLEEECCAKSTQNVLGWINDSLPWMWHGASHIPVKHKPLEECKLEWWRHILCCGTRNYSLGGSRGRKRIKRKNREEVEFVCVCVCGCMSNEHELWMSKCLRWTLA